MSDPTDRINQILSLYSLKSARETYLGRNYEEIERWRHIGLNDLFFFDTVVLGMSRFGMEPMEGPYARRGQLSKYSPEVDFSLHMDLAATINGDWDGKQYLHMNVPRDHFKTSAVTIGYTLQRLARDPNTTVMLIGATLKEQAKSFLHEIKHHIEKNEVFRALYPHVRRGSLWQSDRIIINRDSNRITKEPSVIAMGASGSPETGHYDLIICDDLVCMNNILTRDKAKGIIDFFNMLAPMLNPGGKLINIGTRYADYDLHADIVRNRSAAYKTYIRSACYNEEGQPCLDFEKGYRLFPEEWPASRLQEKLDFMGQEMFCAQMLNDPVPGEFAAIKSDWVEQSFELIDDVPDVTYYMGMDTSTGQAQDFCAIYVVGIDKCDIIHIADRAVGKWSFTKQVEEFFRLYEKYNPMYCQVEAMGSGAAVEQGIIEEGQRRKVYPPCEYVHGHTKNWKTVQVVTVLQPRFESGTIRIPTHFRNSTLVEQLIRFPKAVNDDEVDALGMAVDVASRMGYFEGKREAVKRYKWPPDTIDDLDPKLIEAIRAGRIGLTQEMMDKGFFEAIRALPDTAAEGKRVLRW